MLQRRRTRRRQKKRTRDNAPQFKLCVRLLPPNLTELEFLDTLRCNNVELAQNSYYYVQGHYSAKKFKRQRHSRAYVNLESAEALNRVSRLIERCKFTDDLGNAMIPTLQLSPFTKKLGENEKNTLEGNISKDHIFQTFIKSLRLLSEDKTNTLKYKDISVINPLKKELHRNANMELALQSRKDKALSELAGETKKNEEQQKKKKRKKRKSTKRDKTQTTKETKDISKEKETNKGRDTPKKSEANLEGSKPRRQRRRKPKTKAKEEEIQQEKKSEKAKKLKIKIKQRAKKAETGEIFSKVGASDSSECANTEKTAQKPASSSKNKKPSKRRRSRKPGPKKSSVTSDVAK